MATEAKRPTDKLDIAEVKTRMEASGAIHRDMSFGVDWEAEAATDELAELIRVYEQHGWSIRRVEKEWRCQGEPTIEIIDGILPESERHEPAVVFAQHDRIEEALCLACLHANAEGWL